MGKRSSGLQGVQSLVTAFRSSRDRGRALKRASDQLVACPLLLTTGSCTLAQAGHHFEHVIQIKWLRQQR